MQIQTTKQSDIDVEAERVSEELYNENEKMFKMMEESNLIINNLNNKYGELRKINFIHRPKRIKRS